MEGITYTHGVAPAYQATATARVAKDQLLDADSHELSTPTDLSSDDHEKMARKAADLQQAIKMVNTKLEFRYNKELGEVVVKVIDTDSDTVIKELPSAELQAMHERLHEVIGMLVDKHV